MYKKEYEPSKKIFDVCKRLPREEQYALTGQSHRSLRTVPMNPREAWAKHRYETHFSYRLTDCDGKIGEMDSSLKDESDRGFTSNGEHVSMTSQDAEIETMLGSMILNPQPLLHPDH